MKPMYLNTLLDLVLVALLQFDATNTTLLFSSLFIITKQSSLYLQMYLQRIQLPNQIRAKLCNS